EAQSRSAVLVENPRGHCAIAPSRQLGRGGSAAPSHCFAATALLTRVYQGDYRRQSLPSAAPQASDLRVAPLREWTSHVLPYQCPESLLGARQGNVDP